MNVLHAGRLAKTKGDFKVVQLGLEHIEQVVAMQERVHQSMNQKSWFVCDSGEDIEAMVLGGGAIFGVLNKHNELIASRVVSVPGNSPDNLGLDINLDIELDKVMVLESTVVDPDYRGNRLQGIMLGIAIKQADRLGYRHVLSTVSPHNIYSLYNVMSSGLKIRALKKKYGTAEREGVWRFILHRDLLVQEQSWLKRLEIAVDDFDLQKLLINKGFFGDGVSRKEHTIVYAG